MERSPERVYPRCDVRRPGGVAAPQAQRRKLARKPEDKDCVALERLGSGWRGKRDAHAHRRLSAAGAGVRRRAAPRGEAGIIRFSSGTVSFAGCCGFDGLRARRVRAGGPPSIVGGDWPRASRQNTSSAVSVCRASMRGATWLAPRRIGQSRAAHVRDRTNNSTATCF